MSELRASERAALIANARKLEPTFDEGIHGPGPYEGTDSLLAAALDVLTMHGCADDTNGEADCYGHGARFGRALLVTDSQGFKSVVIFATRDHAREALDELTPPSDDDEGVTFGELSSSGELSNVRVISSSNLTACPHTILLPAHYRADGTCRCNDPTHAEMAEWGYTWNGERWA